MNNLKLLSAAVLLVLAKSASAIEVEPNNDSSKANPLGKENIGKLNRASDVDFFSIDSCLKNEKKECVKYTAADEKKNPLNKAGTDKRREEVSLSFTCNNRSTGNSTSGGWMLGIHDLNGELQETYPVKPEDCILSNSTLGSFNFRFPSLDSPTYFVSVVSDCETPTYETDLIQDPNFPDNNTKKISVKSECKDNYNVGTYTLTDKFKTVEDTSLKSQINLGLQQSGQIKSITDNNVYIVDSDGTTDVPLLFTCNALAIRQSNNWKLSIFNDANGLVNSMLINGSTCGSVFVGDKGGYSFKLPKGSQRYYLAVESACASSTKKDCVVDTSEYSILRDVDKVYSGKLTGKKIDAKSADLKLTNCGLNNNSTISVKAENVNLTEAAKLAKLPVNVQIGSTACRILTPELSKDMIIGSVAQASTIIDSIDKAKDHANIILNDCGSYANAKVTLTGSKLDLVNLTPSDSGVIPIKVSIGNFQCGTNGDVFTINNATAETIYSITTVEKGDVFASLESAKNIGDSQTNQIKTKGDLQMYFVDSSTPANFEFSCPNSKRFTNDWILLTYDSAKTLQSTKIINGSDCGVDQMGDAGTFKFSALSNSPRTYFVVKSACEKGDSVCEVDTSKYTISRIIPDSTICFSGLCKTSSGDAPIFGGN